jgi:putative sigma-54 modulation protein
VKVQINITGRHLDITPPLREYVHKRLRKVTKYSRKINDIHVVFEIQKNQHLVEITLNLSGHSINGSAKTLDMYASIDEAWDKVERQLKKLKERRKEHRVKKKGEMKVISMESGKREIIESEGFAIKPMSTEEALLQMDFSGLEFLVFQNSETERINVIYRRRDGNIGLIEPY